MTGHLWVLVVLPWDGFLVSFSVGLFPSGVGCRRLYCGSRVSCRSDWDSGITLLNWYRFFGNLMCQLLLRSISLTDSWGESLWLRRPFGCCQPLLWRAVSRLLLKQHLGFRRRPILYKLSSVWFAVGRLVSLQWLELSQTCLRWDRSRSIRFSSEVNLLFFRVGDGSLLRSIRRFLRWVSSLNAVDADGFHLELVCGIVDGKIDQLLLGFAHIVYTRQRETIHFRLLDRLQIFC